MGVNMINKIIEKVPISTQADYLIYISTLPKINNAIDLKSLRVIPSGGTHHIYKYNQNPQFLLKVIKKSIGNTLKTLNDDLRALKVNYQNLYEVFGEEKCLVEKHSIQLIQEPQKSKPKYAIVSVVRFEPAFQNKDKIPLGFYSPEENELKMNADTSSYHLSNKGLMGSDKDYRTFNLQVFLKFEPFFTKIFRKIDQNNLLETEMRDFLIKVKLFYHKTNLFLDLKGRDNVIFYPSETGMTYKIGSVLKNLSGKKFRRILDEIGTNPKAINSSFENLALILLVPSWIRGLNALSKKLKMQKVIEYPSISFEDSINLANIHKHLPVKPPTDKVSKKRKLK